MKPVAFLLLVLALVAVACESDDDIAPSGEDAPIASVEGRLDEIAGHVAAWGAADTIAEATAEAEAAANLVVGPGGPGYGDRNGDGTVDGATDEGLLPSLDGSSDGIVLDALGDAECVRRDVLGGAWDDPEARWDEMTDAIDAWAPSDNTMPTLAAHPMRIVGWATFTQTGTLDEAHEYAGHADLHVDVTMRALSDC